MARGGQQIAPRGVRVRARVKGWVGSTPPVPLSDQDVLSARKREQPTAPKIRAANLLGELTSFAPSFTQRTATAHKRLLVQVSVSFIHTADGHNKQTAASSKFLGACFMQRTATKQPAQACHMHSLSLQRSTHIQCVARPEQAQCAGGQS